MQPPTRLAQSAAHRWAWAAALIAGCHANPTPHSTPQDVQAAEQAAQRDVAEARLEAAKDLKSAIKTGGVNSRDVALAKLTAAYDVAMVRAEGDHKVAMEKCLTLQASMLQTCKDQADADYETAKATAKASRVAHPR